MEEETAIPENRMSATKRTVLILLTIFFIGPLVFVGACFPLGFGGFALAFENGNNVQVFLGYILLYSAWVVGLALAILVIYKITKKINKKYNGDSS
jgi:cellobiose-specific phosphotransferase system component IIC